MSGDAGKRLSARTIRPWAGLFTPPAAWYGCQQGMGWAMHATCRSGGPPVGPAVGAVGLLVCLLAGWIAWPAARWPASEPHDSARRFVAWLGVGAAALFALAIGYQTLAMLTVPPCAR